MSADQTFSDSFRALTGHDPFPWQEALYQHLRRGEVPSACDIPTGLGKTAVLPAWLIALIEGGRVPRRLVYVVNRRTVVDQATAEAVRVREALQQLDPASGPLAISTLRGQFADNREWSADPSRPAIIIGTVDMVGSRLLFGGYGLGYRTRPLHAGLLGHDALIVHDEAHLEPAFQAIIEAVQREQEQEAGRLGDAARLRVMALTATPRGGGTTLRLTEEDRRHPEVARRVGARKALHLIPCGDERTLAELLSGQALAHRDSGRAVIVFARSVDVVEKVAERLRKADVAVETLTGTMRGKERDELVGRPVFRRFLPGAERGDGPAYLVCTSAGEVGIDISADHLVCDLGTFESMSQRFGRVNRFGRDEDTRIDILHPEAFDEQNEGELRRKRTLVLLRRLDGDASPAALASLDPAERLAAFSPGPSIPPACDIHFDAWALTTIRGQLPGRPPLAPYLHGIDDPELPRTTIAWREEVGIVVGELMEAHPPAELIADYPLKPHELLSDISIRVFKHLERLAARSPNGPAWLLDEDGEVEPLTLADLADRRHKERIEGRTVLLPPSVGGLAGGLLRGDSDAADDVADGWIDESGRPRRLRLWGGEAPPGMRLVREIDLTADPEASEAVSPEPPERQVWRWFVRPRSADDDGSRTAPVSIPLEAHSQDVEGEARRIVGRLALDEGIGRVVELAARFHDLGKQRTLWQRSIGNPEPTRWLAKLGGDCAGPGWRRIAVRTPYRHEFGSLMDLQAREEFLALGEGERDLLLHLVAAHHGRARPHFEAHEAFDPACSQDQADRMSADVPTRFARLQRRYGRWGLAYLESLLRAADYAASADPSVSVEGTT